MRELEFDFEGTGADGEFRVSGNVLGNIQARIRRGDIDDAARLYTSCVEDIGDALVADLRAGSSAELARKFGEMFVKARDYARAAECAELSGTEDAAASLYEASYQYDKAAALYLRRGDHNHAAQLFERGRDLPRAAALYYQTDNLLKAADCWEQAGQHMQAGKVFLKLSRWDRAVDVLRRIPADSEDYRTACWLLGNVYERSGHLDVAARHLYQSVQALPMDEKIAEVYYRVGQLCERLDNTESAAALYQQITAYKQDFRDVERRLASLVQRDRSELPTSDFFSANASPPEAERAIGVDDDFEVLRRIPLLSELSLTELRHVHTAADKVTYAAGDRLIQQGKKGDALFLLVRGTVRVTTRDGAGTETFLGELGPGAQFGEMALVDDALTSADVTALGGVTAFRLTRDRVDELLVTHERIALRFYRTFVRDLARRLRTANERIQGLTS